MRHVAWIVLLLASLTGCAHNSATDRKQTTQETNAFPIARWIINHNVEHGSPNL